MKIAFILPSLKHVGPNLVVLDLVNVLMKNKHISDICIFYFDNINEIEFPCKIERVSFFRSIDFNKFDIVHSHNLRPDLYIFFNKLFFKIQNTKTVSTLHQYNLINLNFSLKKWYLAKTIDLVWNIALLKHDKIVTLSKHMKEYYENHLFNKKIDFVYNGRNVNILNTDFTVDMLTPLNDIPVLGTACRLINLKGLEQVINVLEKFDKMYFIILGDGPEKNALIKLAKTKSLLNRCIFLGYVSNPLDYYKYFDIFILPSRIEGMPLVLLEAAALNSTAIVCSDLDINKEIFSTKEVSFFKLDNITSLETAIKFAFNNKQQLIKNAYKKYTEKYTGEVMAENYLELYNQLLLSQKNNV